MMSPRTLGEVLPELSAWVRGGLVEIGRNDLGSAIGRMPVTACWAGLVDNFNVGNVSREEYAVVSKLDGRESLRIYQPHGVRRRQWQVGLLVVDGRPRMIGIARPGTLRPALSRLANQLAGPGSSDPPPRS